MSKNLIIIALVTILLSACSTWVSVNPLSPPVETDKKLEGLWKLDSKDNDKVYLHIGKKSENTMQALSVEHKNDGTLDIIEIPFFITMAGKNNYFNVRYEDIEKSVSKDGKGFIFVKYSLSDDNTLSIYQFDPEPIITAVQSGKLKGEIYYKESSPTPEGGEKENSSSKKLIDSVKITDTSENMVKFFNSKENKYISDVMKFIKVK